ncbi:MAG: LemA family protein [Nitriliruptorales bacterium]|nr:LemA family protein [Nitriliruptorales bacterium]
MGWILGGIAIAGIAWLIVVYNRLVARRNRVEEAWAGIDVQLQRRADLVPNLVETVKGYAGHERRTLEDVTEARTRLVQADNPEDAEQADAALDAALGRLFALAEDYPELRASENFLALQRELAEIEEELSFARRYYNSVVENHNTGIEQFPTLLVARPFGFERRPYFRAGEDERVAPQVDLER